MDTFRNAELDAYALATSLQAPILIAGIVDADLVAWHSNSACNIVGSSMQYVCDAGAATWFRIETPGEALLESQAMNHAVEKFFREAYDKAASGYVPPKTLAAFEQRIGLKAHIQRVMPRFLTLRDKDGKVLVTAMLPPDGQDTRSFRPVIVGPANADPYASHGEAIRKLGDHYRLTLDPARCYPYRRA